MGEQNSTEALNPNDYANAADLNRELGITGYDANPDREVVIVDRTRTRVSVEPSTVADYETRINASIGGDGLLITLTADETDDLIDALQAIARGRVRR